MKKLVVSIVMLAATSAMADGFVCESLDGALKVKVFNKTQPSEGTRNAAIMILSDASVGFGNKTIAKLSAEATTLSNEGTSYQGKVDLRRVDSDRSGELVAGTKLGYIKNINLEVDFSYARPVLAGTSVRGWLNIEKRDGSTITEKLECQRYLKGE